MNHAVGLNIICVDDEQSALVNCKAAIHGNPDVTSAKYFESPTDALAHVKENPVDVALLDIDMPEMNGFELAERLKTLSETIKIAFVTGNTYYMRMANRPTKAPFVFKPYSDYDIADILEQVKCGA